MALIKCPECGREGVSDSANACPQCGFNIEKYFQNKDIDDNLVNTDNTSSLHSEILLNGDKIYVCPKCGNIISDEEYKDVRCPSCNSFMEETQYMPDEYINNSFIEQNIIKEYCDDNVNSCNIIKTNHEKEPEVSTHIASDEVHDQIQSVKIKAKRLIYFFLLIFAISTIASGMYMVDCNDKLKIKNEKIEKVEKDIRRTQSVMSLDRTTTSEYWDLIQREAEYLGEMDSLKEDKSTLKKNKKVATIILIASIILLIVCLLLCI